MRLQPGAELALPGRADCRGGGRRGNRCRRRGGDRRRGGRVPRRGCPGGLFRVIRSGYGPRPRGGPGWLTVRQRWGRLRSWRGNNAHRDGRRWDEWCGLGWRRRLRRHFRRAAIRFRRGRHKRECRRRPAGGEVGRDGWARRRRDGRRHSWRFRRCRRLRRQTSCLLRRGRHGGLRRRWRQSRFRRRGSLGWRRSGGGGLGHCRQHLERDGDRRWRRRRNRPAEAEQKQEHRHVQDRCRDQGGRMEPLRRSGPGQPDGAGVRRLGCSQDWRSGGLHGIAYLVSSALAREESRRRSMQVWLGSSAGLSSCLAN